MKSTRLFYVLIALLSITFVSCSKDEEDPGSGNNGGGNGGNTYDPGKVVLDFSNMCNGHGVNVSGSTAYANNVPGQNFRVKKFRYYVSNVVLITKEGSEHAVQGVYHLVTEDSSSTRDVSLGICPGGEYVAVKFTMGVDAARVAAGNFTGDLDPAHGMFISASDGFAAIELNGHSNDSPLPDSSIAFKIGGIGANNTLRTFQCSFNGQTLIVDGPRNAVVHLFAEILEMWRVPQTIDFSTTHHVTTPGSQAVMVADNYADMFRFDHLHN